MRKYWMMALAVALGALLGGALLATPASAQADPAFEHGYPDVTADATDKCGEIELTFINPTPWLFVFDVRVDGEEAINPSVAPGVEIEEGPLAGQEFGPRWRLVTVDGSDDVHEMTEMFEFTSSVEVRLAEGAEQKLFFDWKTVDVSEVDECPEPTPTATESPTATASPTPSASPTPGVTEEPSTAPSAEAEPELPVTGSNLPVALGGAAVLLGLTGGGLMALARRRRTTFRAE